MTGIPARLLPHTVTIVHPVETIDSHGNAIRSPGVSHTSAAFVQPRTQSENHDQRDELVGTWRMFTNDPDVGGYDQVLWSQDGAPPLTFEVVGPPATWDNPSGLHHNEVTIRLVEG